MPILELTYPAGAFAGDARATLLDELAGIMLEHEGAPDTEFFRSVTWVYANEIPADALAVGGRPGGEPRFRLVVTVPDGALSQRRKTAFTGVATAAVLRAAGLEESEAPRVFVLINEVPNGNWGAAGQTIDYETLVAAAAHEREQSAATTAS